MQEWGTAVLTPLIMKLEHFLPLPDGDKEWLNGLILRLDEFPAHSDIIREGEISAGVFVVIAGHACRYKILSNGGRQILDFMFPGDKTELHSLLLRAIDHGIFTLGPTTIARIDRDRLIGEIIDHPNVTIALWWNALQREAILRERITAIGRARCLCTRGPSTLRDVPAFEVGGRDGRPALHAAGHAGRDGGCAGHLRGLRQPQAAAPAK